VECDLAKAKGRLTSSQVTQSFHLLGVQRPHPAEQIGLSIEAADALIGNLFIKQADPLIRHFEKLKVIIR
jgi:hypothetical protein